MNVRSGKSAVRAGMVAMLLGAAIGCGGEQGQGGGQAPITPDMEKQAEASSKYLMDQMQAKEKAK